MPRPTSSDASHPEPVVGEGEDAGPADDSGRVEEPGGVEEPRLVVDAGLVAEVEAAVADAPIAE